MVQTVEETLEKMERLGSASVSDLDVLEALQEIYPEIHVKRLQSSIRGVKWYLVTLNPS